MATVLACVDGSVYAESVAGHACWAAERLGAGLELLQVLGRRDATAEDRSGRIAAGARRRLLERLAELDAERAKLALAEARIRLDELGEKLVADGAAPVAKTLRNGDLLETIAERVAAIDASMIVVGKRGEAADFAKMHLGSNLERILRAAPRPTLVASRAWKPIHRFAVAFDGRPSAERAIDAVESSALFHGLQGFVVYAGEPSSAAAEQCEAAAARLRSAGMDVVAYVVAGSPTDVVPRFVADHDVDLLAMGAYGHSALRSMVLGSTTSAVIRGALVPVLVYRA